MRGIIRRAKGRPLRRLALLLLLAWGPATAWCQSFYIGVNGGGGIGVNPLQEHRTGYGFGVQAGVVFGNGIAIRATAATPKIDRLFEGNSCIVVALDVLYRFGLAEAGGTVVGYVGAGPDLSIASAPDGSPRLAPFGHVTGGIEYVWSDAGAFIEVAVPLNPTTPGARVGVNLYL